MIEYSQPPATSTVEVVAYMMAKAAASLIGVIRPCRLQEERREFVAVSQRRDSNETQFFPS
jgi:hypothetical protein